MKKVKIIVLRCSFNEGLLKGYGIEGLHARSSEKVRCSTPDLGNRKVSVMAHGMPFIHMCLLWQDERVDDTERFTRTRCTQNNSSSERVNDVDKRRVFI